MSAKSSDQSSGENFLIGLSRAFAGAIIFSFSILMTMEMWTIGFTIPPLRLLLFILFFIPVLIGLSYFVGFKETENLADDVIDAFVGFAVGFIASAIMLYLFSIIDLGMSYYEIISKISVQTVTAAIGAMYAQSQLGSTDNDFEESSEEKKRRSSYWGELFLMLVGAIFLAMNPASTEEMYLIAFMMSDLQVIILALLSLVVMHAFVYSVGFKGEEEHEDLSFVEILLRFTVVGYAIALLISFYLLWTFGSLDGMSLEEMLRTTVVLGFPAALGAAASRVIL